MTEKDRIWLLMARKDSGEITPEELMELEWRLCEDETLNNTYGILKKVFHSKFTVEGRPVDIKTSWKAIKGQIYNNQYTISENSRRISLKRLLAAASILVLMASGIVAYINIRQEKQGQKLERENVNQVYMQLGSRSKLILPDGTKVWLNAGSRLSYNDFINDSIREVNLSGEAYFEVVHDASHPFIIHVGNIEVRDIGTSFAVRAYPEDKRFEATLIEGAIEIINHGDSKRKILLKPREKIIIPVTDSILALKPGFDDNKNMLYKIDKVAKDNHGLIPETAWVHNKLVFNNEPFYELAKRMERWYNVKIHFEDSLISQKPFSGIIENETLEQALKAMQFSTSFGFLMKGNDIWINKK